MELLQNLLIFIISVAAFQGVLLSAYLFANHRRQPGNVWLGALVLIISVMILGPALGVSNYYLKYPHLMRIGDPLVILIGPFLWFYVNRLTNDEVGLTGKWLHLLPFFFYMIWISVSFYSLSGDEKIVHIERALMTKDHDWLTLVLAPVRMIYVFVYVLAARDRWFKFKEELKIQFSAETQMRTDWLQQVLNFFILLFLVGFTLFFFAAAKTFNFLMANYFVAIFMAMGIYYLGYRGLFQQKFFKVRRQIFSLKGDLENHPSLENDPRLEKLGEKLKAEILDKEAFRESEISLQTMADALGVPAYLLSQCLNKCYGQSFFDFVNSHRIAWVQKQLADPSQEKFTIMGIAFEAGFNSKSSFNTAFKKYTGTTPSAYRAQLKN